MRKNTFLLLLVAAACLAPANGTEGVLLRNLNLPSGTHAQMLAADQRGSLFVVVADAEGYALRATKVDATGTVVGGFDLASTPLRIVGGTAVDGDGNCVLAGWGRGGLVVVKVDSELGRLLFAKAYGGEGMRSDLQ